MTKANYQAADETLFLKRRLQPKAAAAPNKGSGPGTGAFGFVYSY